MSYYDRLLFFDSQEVKFPEKEACVMPRWPEWITAEYLRQMTRCLRIGDVWFLPQMICDFKKFTDINQLPTLLKRWAEKIEELRFMVPNITEFEIFFDDFKKGRFPSEDYNLRDIETAANNLFLMFTLLMKEIYWRYFQENNPCSYRYLKNFQEPVWFDELPEIIQGDFRTLGATRRFDDPWIFPEFPFTGISYLVRGGGFFSRIANAINLWRLTGIVQLSNLMDPTPVYARGFEHTRFVHSIDTYVLMLLVLYNNRRNLPRGFFKNALVAALIHDLATPAGGDGTKMVAPDQFDEEKNLPEYIKMYWKSWETICRQLNLDQNDIFDSVRGIGLGGKVLDPLDKLAYGSRDSWIFLNRYNPNAIMTCPTGYSDVLVFSQLNPLFCSVWDSIKIMGNDIIFLDPKRLGSAMHARALMCKNLYFNAPGRSFEAVLANCVLSYLYAEGKINRKMLYQMEDLHLEQIVSKFTGVSCAFFASHALGEIVTETYATLEEALRKEKEIIDGGNVFVVIEDTRGRIKSATHFLVSNSSGKIQPFFEACPEEASAIQSIVKLDKAVFLHYLKNFSIDPEALEKLRVFRKKELERRNREKK